MSKYNVIMIIVKKKTNFYASYLKLVLYFFSETVISEFSFIKFLKKCTTNTMN